MSNRSIRQTALLVVASGLVCITSQAQDYHRIAPKPAPTANSAAPPVADSSKPVTESKSDAVVVPELKGLLFVSSPSGVISAGVDRAGLSLNMVERLDVPRVREKLDGYLGKPLTFDQLNEITRFVVEYYRSQNHPLVDVVVPQQDVQKGTIQVVVNEFKVGSVRVQGNKWFSSRIIAAPVTLKNGQSIDTQHLLRQLDAINANPFRRVNLVYQPSSQAGYTDLVLETQDRFPLRVYTGFDNSGTPVTGRNRWNFGANWGNALWHDQQLSYQLTTSSDFWNRRSTVAGEPSGASFVGQSLSWTMPLSWRDSITIFGAYEQSTPNIGQNLGLVGRSGQASIRYNLSLPRTASFTQTAQAGFDFKTTNNNLDFGGAQISQNSSEVDQFPVSYSANLTDHWGVTGATTTLVFSPGGITPNNKSSAFQPALGQSGRDMASAHYFYWRSDVNRLTKLPGNAVWAVRLLGQVSSGSLLNTEQLALGGPELLRGYDPYSLLGDQGIVLSNELRSPSFGPHGAAGSNDRPGYSKFGQVQVLGFWDYASLHNKNPSEYYIANLDASSVGVGFRYGIRTYMSIRFDYGWQLQRQRVTNSRGELANISVLLGN